MGDETFWSFLHALSFITLERPSIQMEIYKFINLYVVNLGSLKSFERIHLWTSAIIHKTSRGRISKVANI